MTLDSSGMEMPSSKCATIAVHSEINPAQDCFRASVQSQRGLQLRYFLCEIMGT
jgi:hypothetical protein